MFMSKYLLVTLGILLAVSFLGNYLLLVDRDNKLQEIAVLQEEKKSLETKLIEAAAQAEADQVSILSLSEANNLINAELSTLRNTISRLRQSLMAGALQDPSTVETEENARWQQLYTDRLREITGSQQGN